MDPIPTEYNRSDHPFIINDVPSKYTLLDFWSWAFSDVLTNTTRGIVAEFIIATALGIDIKKPRDEWGKFDLTYKNHGIEVKSASYHQRWYQQRLSTISFNVPKRKGWDANTNKLDPISRRQADIYVLSLLAEKHREKVNPLNIDQWEFWVVDTSFFDKRARSQHSITYNSLLKEIGNPIRYNQLKIAIDSLIEKKLAQKFAHLILSCAQKAIFCSLRLHRLESLCHPLTATWYQTQKSKNVGRALPAFILVGDTHPTYAGSRRLQPAQAEACDYRKWTMLPPAA